MNYDERGEVVEITYMEHTQFVESDKQRESELDALCTIIRRWLACPEQNHDATG